MTDSNRGALIQEDTTIIGKIRNCSQIEIRGYVEGDVVADYSSFTKAAGCTAR